MNFLCRQLGLCLIFVYHGATIVNLLLLVGERDRTAMGAPSGNPGTCMAVTEGRLATASKHRRILVAGEGMVRRVHI